MVNRQGEIGIWPANRTLIPLAESGHEMGKHAERLTRQRSQAAMAANCRSARRRCTCGWLVLALCCAGTGSAGEVSLLQQAKQACPDVVKNARAAAEAALLDGPFTVMDKIELPPSGDRHDFATLSPYYWPNPDRGDGLPYVFRDGQLNPEASSDKYDRVRYFAMGDAVKACAVGYRLFGERRYADHAARLLRTWFLDPATRMNPHLKHAQQVPGKSEGSQTGIIRGMLIVELVDAARDLEGSKSWTADDQSRWRAWLSDYLDWLRDSDLGRREARAFNNHSTWYDVQLATLAIACGRREIAIDVVRQVGPRRIAPQIRPDGRQPMELMRTKSWDYSVMNLEGLFALAEQGQLVDVDLWRWEDDEGRSLRRALDYLIPFATGDAAWPGKQIREFEPGKLYPLLLRAHEAYEAPKYAEAITRLSDFDPSKSPETLSWMLRGARRSDDSAE